MGHVCDPAGAPISGIPSRRTSDRDIAATVRDEVLHLTKTTPTAVKWARSNPNPTDPTTGNMVVSFEASRELASQSPPSLGVHAQFASANERLQSSSANGATASTPHGSVSRPLGAATALQLATRPGPPGKAVPIERPTPPVPTPVRQLPRPSPCNGHKLPPTP